MANQNLKKLKHGDIILVRRWIKISDNILARYSVEVYDSTGNFLADLSGIATLSNLTVERNRASSAVIDIDLFKLENFARSQNLMPLDILSVNVNEIRVRRYQRYVFAGQISNIEPNLQDNGSVIHVNVSGWLDILAQRYTGSNDVHTSEDLSNIAWDLISTTQALSNGNLGITRGVHPTTTNYSITYNAKNVRDAIVDLSNLNNGFDFEITWDKVFNIYYPHQGFDHSSDLRFEYPYNIKQLVVQRDGTKMANSVTARGAGSGTSQLSDIETDTPSQTAYKLRQRILDFPDTSTIASLQGYAQSELGSYKNIVDVPQIVIDGNLPPTLGSYWIGDQITLFIDDLKIFSFMSAVKYKIDKIEVVMDSEEQEEITLSLSTF